MNMYIVINSIGGRHTYTYVHRNTHAHTHIPTLWLQSVRIIKLNLISDRTSIQRKRIPWKVFMMMGIVIKACLACALIGPLV